MTGVLMISLALVADAVIGNVQEKTIKQFNASNSEVAQIVNSSRLYRHCQLSGCVVQLQYWICLLIFPGGRLHRHCLCHQLLLILSKTNLWICLYIFPHRIPGNTGEAKVSELFLEKY